MVPTNYFTIKEENLLHRYASMIFNNYCLRTNFIYNLSYLKDYVVKNDKKKSAH